jgi:hypothetical protein
MSGTTEAEPVQLDAEKVGRVRDRLAVVKHLIEANHPLAVPHNVGPTKSKAGTMTGGWVHTHAQLDGLAVYLLLTCFDFLGQSKDWVSFHEWLRSSATRAERELAVGGNSDDAAAACTKMQDWYNQKYGVRQAFNRFVSDILDPQSRSSLLKSVQYTDMNPPVSEMSDKAKVSMLYDLRNNFTHELQALGGARLEGGERIFPASSQEPERGFPRHHLFTSEKQEMCMVRDWPFKLYNAVASAIGEPPSDFSVRYTLVLRLSSGRTVIRPRLDRRELADQESRQRLFAELEADDQALDNPAPDGEPPPL